MAATQSDTKTKTRTIDILIVGAGIAGTALASFLLLTQLKSPSELRFHITILERSPSIQGHGQNIDIRGPGKDLLKKLGIDEDARAVTTRRRRCQIY
jgi:2-polyprenyl-6-methoxyphenol hydroxylase-like FAD-dependent oxidoreductase